MDENEEDEEETRVIRRKPKTELPDAGMGLAQATRMLSPEPLPTEVEGDEEMTQLAGSARRTTRLEPAPAASDDGGEADPIVGWLVVLEGPGRGNARRLGYGQNTLGREKSERVPLDFGDTSISRSKHCFIIYEPRKRQYFLRPGEGSNLTYLNGELIAETRPLEANQVIEIGNTKLKFVPLCGPDFDWEDPAPAGK